MKIKLVATDMDGTLLNSKKEVPGDFAEWVRRHPDIKTVIASGRQYYTLEKDFRDIRDELLFIAENGALVFDKGAVLYKNVMEERDVLDCIDLIEKIPCATAILCGTRSAYIAERARADEDVRRNAAMYYERLRYVEKLRSIVGQDDIVKLAVYFRQRQAEGSLHYFGGLRPELLAVVSGESWIDVANRSADKGNAVTAIREKYGIAREECMAFGDYLNDLQLLQACGESYCMENGHEKLKEIAKHIAASNDEDGVMKVLRGL